MGDDNGRRAISDPDQRKRTSDKNLIEIRPKAPLIRDRYDTGGPLPSSLAASCAGVAMAAADTVPSRRSSPVCLLLLSNPDRTFLSVYYWIF